MNIRTESVGSTNLLEIIALDAQVNHPQDALTLVGLCMEHEAQLLLLNADVLGDDFFRLRSGVAGEVMQKLVNYCIRTAIVVARELSKHGKFEEMALEANRGNHVRIFEDRKKAVEWLVQVAEASK